MKTIVASMLVLILAASRGRLPDRIDPTSSSFSLTTKATGILGPMVIRFSRRQTWTSFMPRAYGSPTSMSRRCVRRREDS